MLIGGRLLAATLDTEARMLCNTVAVWLDSLNVEMDDKPEGDVDDQHCPAGSNGDLEELHPLLVQQVNHHGGEGELREPVKVLHIVIDEWLVENWL